MERRTLLAAIVGVAGAGLTLRAKNLVGAGPSGGAARIPIARAQLMRNVTSPGLSSVALAQVPLGAGGFVTGIDISADGSRYVCRTDVANGYVRDEGSEGWRPLFSPASMGLKSFGDIPSNNDKADSDGVAGVRIAPSNKNVIYATKHGYVWRSNDGGRSLQRLSLPQKRMLTGAGWQRLYNRTIDVHPLDAERVVVGTWGDGAWQSSDGGRSWKALALPPTTKSHDDHPGINLVAFDLNPPHRLYVFVTGVGLFRSDAAEQAAFQLLGGGPRFCSNLVAAADGSMYLCEQTKGNVGGRVYRYSPGEGWTSGQASPEPSVLAIEREQPANATLIDPNGHFLQSHDHCQTFIDHDSGKRFASGGGEIRWMEGLVTAFPAEARFHPVTNELFIAQGVGVARTDVHASNVILSDWSAGIESLCITSALVLPSGQLLLSAWDKPFWRVTDLTSYRNEFRYPLRPGKSHSANLVAYSSSLDAAGDDPNFLIGVVAPGQDSAPGYSRDGGQNWEVFAGEPTSGWGFGGAIAASTSKNFVLLPSNNGVGVYTLDGGRSWEPIRLNGTVPTSGFANAYYVARRNITADKTRPGVFALVYTTIKNNEYQEPLGGLWLTRDGGQTWQQRLQGVVSVGSHEPRAVLARGQDARQYWACQLNFVPGRRGELVYTGHADFKDDQFLWSADDGATWTELHRSIRNVDCFGFGKAAPGCDRPALYFSGEVNGKRGLFASFDWFAAPPVLVTRFPSEILSPATCVAGDPQRFGRLYVGTGAAGCVRIEIQV